MLTDADWTRIANDLAELRQDNETIITIRRGSTTLAAQTARIARQGSVAGVKDSEGGQTVRGRVVVLGSTTFDVQPGDRFNDANGTLYQVVFVRPNRRAAVIAEAEAVE